MKTIETTQKTLTKLLGFPATLDEISTRWPAGWEQRIRINAHGVVIAEAIKDSVRIEMSDDTELKARAFLFLAVLESQEPRP